MENTPIYLLLLGAGLLHALTHVYLKQTNDRVLTYAVVNCVSLVFALPLLYFTEPTDSFPWLYFSLSVALHLLHKLFVIAAYKVGDLSKVFPISRGASPIFALLGAWIFMGEKLLPNQFYGVAIIASGIAGLSLYGVRNAHGNLISVGYAVGTAIVTASYTILDGLGTRQLGDPIRYIAFLYIADAALYSTFVIPFKRKEVLSYMKTQGVKATISGACAILSYGAVIVAMQFGSIGIAATLRETSMIFATIIGGLLLREPLGKMRTALSIIVFTGVAILLLTRGA